MKWWEFRSEKSWDFGDYVEIEGKRKWEKNNASLLKKCRKEKIGSYAPFILLITTINICNVAVATHLQNEGSFFRNQEERNQ